MIDLSVSQVGFVSCRATAIMKVLIIAPLHPKNWFPPSNSTRPSSNSGRWHETFRQ